MKYILWAQNEAPEIKPTILVDGVKIGGDESQNYFSKLNQVNQNLAFPPELREELYERWKDEGFSQQTNYSILDNNQGVYIQSCYVERDLAGRKMPYMFYYGNGSNLREAISVLKEASAQLGRNCNEKDLIIIEGSHLVSKKKEIIKYFFLFIIALVICLILNLTL